MAAKKIALFIDADNISAKFGKQIIDTLESRGEIFIRRIYGNWEKISLHGWNECILNFSLRAVQQPDFAAGKNATDMSLTIDAMDVLYGGHANIFALVSNDSDFTPLVIRLREGGMNVIGMGNDNASISFRNACNEFINLDKAIEPPKPAPPLITPSTPKVMTSSERNKKLQQIHNILREAAKVHGDAKGFFLLNMAGMEIKKIKLDVKVLGYDSLQNFVADFPKLYEVKKSGNVVYYRCLTSEPKPKSPDAKLQPIHEVLREVAKAHKDLNDGDGFTDLTRVGQKAREKKLSIRALGYSSWSKFVSNFPKLYKTKKVGSILYYRCC